jgi:hypothetical protein
MFSYQVGIMPILSRVIWTCPLLECHLTPRASGLPRHLRGSVHEGRRTQRSERYEKSYPSFPHYRLERAHSPAHSHGAKVRTMNVRKSGGKC